MTPRCIVDEIVAAADMVKGTTQGVPVELTHGLGRYVIPDSPWRAKDSNLDQEIDLLRLRTEESYPRAYADDIVHVSI